MPNNVPVAWHWRVGLQDNSFSILWLGELLTFFGDRAFALHGVATQRLQRSAAPSASISVQ
jgi:hypothetical protein